jgi:hypothetical protein
VVRPPAELARATAHLWRAQPHVCIGLSEALEVAGGLTTTEDCLCVTGSVFVVGDALRALGRGEP